MIEGLSWQWIFWINVPIGLALMPLAWRRLDETRGPATSLDLRGLALVSAGLLGVVWGLVRGNGQGWTSPEIVGSLTVGVLLVAAFVLWELRAREPMLPMRFFRNRTFSHANVASFFMFFGMFGSIFLLAQFFQTVQGYSPLQAGLRILPWTAMPIFVAPIAGALSDRIGGQRIMGVGLASRRSGSAGWPPSRRPPCRTRELVGPFILSGIGMAPLLRAGRQRRAEHGAAAGGGAGLGRQQRHPRAGRRVRRRGAGLDLREVRRLRVRADASSTGSCRPSGSARRSSASAPSRR